MTWHWFNDDFDDDFTPFERAQVLALQEVVRECVATQQRLMDILYWLATRLAPEEVDRRLTRNPFAFARMTPQAWRTFFEQALHDLYLTRGVAPPGRPGNWGQKLEIGRRAIYISPHSRFKASSASVRASSNIS